MFYIELDTSQVFSQILTITCKVVTTLYLLEEKTEALRSEITWAHTWWDLASHLNLSDKSTFHYPTPFSHKLSVYLHISQCLLIFVILISIYRF